MGDRVWTDGDRWTVAELLGARVESDPDGALFDINGEQWTARGAHGGQPRGHVVRRLRCRSR